MVEIDAVVNLTYAWISRLLDLVEVQHHQRCRHRAGKDDGSDPNVGLPRKEESTSVI